mgnify:CR=1 FL=1|jgi:hypothetical protein
MSKILVSGCGITFSGERPTWSKVLRISGYSVTDVSGPAISNHLILNQLLQKVYEENFDHVICQLTSFGKLDVELNRENQSLMNNDSLRNFSYNGYWPSSHSTEHKVKRDYEKYLYSPSLDEQDTIFKLLLLQSKCNESNTELHIIQGYPLVWKNKLVDRLGIDTKFSIYEMYKNSKFYMDHDYSNNNTVPNKHFQIYFAKHIAKEYLKEIKPALEKFYE